MRETRTARLSDGRSFHHFYGKRKTWVWESFWAAILRSVLVIPVVEGKIVQPWEKFQSGSCGLSSGFGLSR